MLDLNYYFRKKKKKVIVSQMKTLTTKLSLLHNAKALMNRAI